MRHHASDDVVERDVVVELPAERGDVLSRPTLQQEAAFVVVEPESKDVPQHIVDVHADAVAAETPPITELLGFDDHVSEVDIAEHARHERASSPCRETL
ncbi:Uncharacterised protein [Mycolicibacterium fortuitum]|uniref:Uncharacterized protein n=1 Tax=Mycolicibacterium fortuitum TaxID=1766 RepID=A0A378U9M1_MYCFO|nr:Uncharacterised protein [Mycolicibacterium fortuitum]